MSYSNRIKQKQLESTKIYNPLELDKTPLQKLVKKTNLHRPGGASAQTSSLRLYNEANSHIQLKKKFNLTVAGLGSGMRRDVTNPLL